MKALLTLTVGLCLLFAVVPVTAQSAADEAAIKKVIEQKNAAWNKHQSDGLNTENFENWSGSRKGQAANSEFWSEYYKRDQNKNLQYSLLNESRIVFVTPDVAIYKSVCETSGRLDESGKALPPYKWRGAWVMVKKNGKWLSAALFSRPIEE